ncbi:uncharacterized protein LOC121595608 [Anopheles merus]|uniref:uncharacterized protein LOC121595608 n=1 Tax=Anopheles merus TaxID=30066 RepID=UPI001BE4A567|nr:uncharacterized protein LOC121595608 [Anopheles merus]
MQSTGVVGVTTVSLLIVAFCQIVVAQFHQCTGSETCINIKECPRFGPHYHEPAKWSDSLRQEFRSKVCKREQSNGKNLYKVCCKRAATGNKNNRERGLATLDLEGCGAYSEDRIAFGQDAKLFQYPWMALLKQRAGNFVCGGTLINERYVLTAAHCIKNNDITTVRLGEFDLSTSIDCDKRGEQCAPSPQDIFAEQTIVHEAYSARRKENDIGLVRLAKEAEYNDNVLPICLPVTPAMRTTQTIYFVAGWGATESAPSSNRLQFTKLSLLPNDQCVQKLLRVDSFAKINNDQMCAVGTNLTDNCTGDSGGPLKTISINARYVQYGVVSYGLRTCGKQSAPGVYTRVENYVDWILEHLEKRAHSDLKHIILCSDVLENSNLSFTGLYVVKFRVNMQHTMVGMATVLLLIVAFCQIVVAQFHQCTGGETCISINECPLFGPHYHEPSKWSEGLLNEFRSKVCKRKQSNGRNLYKVCCNRAATDNKNNRERGLATLDLEECGAYSADRMAYGQEARLFEFPWMALLMPSSGKFVCGGTLINRRYVLTAAHCLKKTHVTTVRLGEFDLSTPIDYNKRGDQHAPPPQDIVIEQTIVHEAYNGRLKVNDIGLIRLAEEAAYNDNVAPICLPVSPAMRTTQTTYFVAGWGATESAFYSNRLLFGKVTLLPNDQCVQQLQRLDSFAKINNEQMCAIGANLTDNCTGDSGGPLKTISINARYVQYGVVSYGLRTCGKQSAPGVYTRVENYVDWILDHLEE